MPRKLWFVALAGLVVGSAIVIWKPRAVPAQALSSHPENRPAEAPAVRLPVSQVVLFNSGVGYFQRDGQVSGTTQIELGFPGSDVNDLLKSLVLQDLDGGTVAPVTYDSADPAEKTLRTFALDLTYNPTVGQLLNQARGEKIELTMFPVNGMPPASLTGTILGMETRGENAYRAEVDILNLLCEDGLRSVQLSYVQRLRFLNTALDGELKRALEVLASAHDTQKRTVRLSFVGEGNRRVRVGYVIESPMWKTSYRLVLRDNSKPYLQGWAVVENTTDADWKDVRLALVSGRPISFEMDLYQPLYVPRPTAEPELFASLRPPVYQGAMATPQALGGIGAGLGALGGGQGFGGGLPSASAGQGILRGSNRYQPGAMGGIGQGRPIQNAAVNPAGNPGEDEDNAALRNRKLAYEELRQRLKQRDGAKEQARSIGSFLTAVDPREGIASLAAAHPLGDRFQYVIKDSVTLPRQRSALIPLVQAEIEATRVSVYNEATQATFPILGLKLKNTAHQPLTQGPVTVYDRGSYAGDAQLMDLQPNEERLIGYALDLGTEVKVETKPFPQQLIAVTIVRGVLHVRQRVRETRTYLVQNRAIRDRTLLIEHPIRSDWKLVTPAQPSERSRDHYRFQLTAPGGKAVRLEVVEEKTPLETIALADAGDKVVRVFLNSAVASSRVKEGLAKAIELKTALAATQRELARQQDQVQGLTADQERLRANLTVLPKDSASYRRYVQRLDDQETEIEHLHKQIAQVKARAGQQAQAYEDYLQGLTVE
jgi:hypothetical protein